MRSICFSTVLFYVLMVGCQKQEMTDYVEMKGIQEVPEKLTALMENVGEVRTSVQNGNVVVWNIDDNIAVFNDNVNSCRYKVADEDAGTADASFILEEVAVVGQKTGMNVALYPYADDVLFELAEDGCCLNNVVFPAVQQYTPSSFASGAFPMAAVSDLSGLNYSFRNLGGVLKLNITGTHAIRSIVVKGNNNESLSGTASLFLASGKLPEVSMNEDANKTLTLDCGSEGVLLDPDVPTEFMLAIPPVEFERGFSVVITEIGGAEMIVNTIKHNPVKRSSILNMPSINFEPVVETIVNIEAVSVSFKGIEVKIEAKGAAQYSGGCKLEKDFSYNAVAREANWSLVPRIEGGFVYYGPMTGFNSEEAPVAIPGETYVVWVASYAKGQKMVKEADITIMKFTVPAVVPGGSLSVEINRVVTGSKSLEFSLAAEGASVIYSALLTPSEIALLKTEEAKIAYLLENVTPFVGSSAEYNVSGLTPETNMTLLTLAVDSNGCYGKLGEKEFLTSSLTFNEKLKVNLSLSYDLEQARIQVSSTGGDVIRYYYYAGKTSSSAWKTTLGGSINEAEVFMLLNYDHFVLSDTDRTPLVDGCIVMNNLDLAVEYIVVVVAAGSDGRFSRAASVKFTPEKDMGEFVYRSGNTEAKWNASVPQINFGECWVDTEFYVIEWSVVPAEGMKAYTLCTHPNVMSAYGNAKKKAMYIFDKGVEVVPGKMEVESFGDKGNYVYVTWCDEYGNFYEPVLQSVPQPKEQ